MIDFYPGNGPATYRGAWPSKMFLFEITMPCGHTGTIPTSTHRMLVDGRIEPSVICTHDGCTFHDFIRLCDPKEAPDERR